MKTIAVVNQKGGCGKTTISINLSSALAEAGQKVLLVDMDPQSHCAVGLAVPEEQIEQSIYDVLISRSRNEPIKLTEILWQINDRLELAPSSIDLSVFEQQMTGIAERERCLQEALNEMKNDYEGGHQRHSSRRDRLLCSAWAQQAARDPKHPLQTVQPAGRCQSSGQHV